jgi:MoxR-like ATPase
MEVSRRVYLPEVVASYIARLVDATHPERSASAQGVKFGASPRAAIALAAASRARALLEGRLNASFEDVAAAAKPVLRHRLILDYSARLEGQTTDGVVEALLQEVAPDNVAVAATLEEAR